MSSRSSSRDREWELSTPGPGQDTPGSPAGNRPPGPGSPGPPGRACPAFSLPAAPDDLPPPGADTSCQLRSSRTSRSPRPHSPGPGPGRPPPPGAGGSPGPGPAAPLHRLSQGKEDGLQGAFRLFRSIAIPSLFFSVFMWGPVRSTGFPCPPQVDLSPRQSSSRAKKGGRGLRPAPAGPKELRQGKGALPPSSRVSTSADLASTR